MSSEAYGDAGYSWNARATDNLDALCRSHDKSCSSGTCSVAADRRLIRGADRIATSIYENTFHRRKVRAAQKISAAVRLGQLRRG
jgi:hypothetical protein